MLRKAEFTLYSGRDHRATARPDVAAGHWVQQEQNPPGNEQRAVEYLKTVLEAEGIAVKTFELDPDRPNLVARIKGSGKKRPLLIVGHTDVVTVDQKKWKFRLLSGIYG